MSEAVNLYEVKASAGESLEAVISIEVGKLHRGPCLRLGGLKRGHIASLVQSGGNWPPIVIRREDNTIVDGLYRYLAARKLGHSHIDCVYFDGGPEPAFFEALRRNLQHGLPLSLREREAAARRILAFHPDWSDRRLSETCGLSPATVGKVRREIACSRDQNEQVNARVGRDGKTYPTDPATSRERILTALREDPRRSLRSVAKATGTSPATVRAVKSRLAPVVSASSPDPAHPAVPSAGTSDAASMAADSGVTVFARWFERTSISEEWRDLVAGIPPDRLHKISDEARRRAQRWLEFASMLEARARRS